MSTTPVSGTEHLGDNSDQPEVPVNAMVDAVETMENFTKEWTVTGDFTATQVQMSAGKMHELNGSPAATFAFGIYPVSRLFLLQNNTGQTCNVYVQGLSGTSVVVTNGQTVLLLCDGVNVAKLTLS